MSLTPFRVGGRVSPEYFFGRADVIRTVVRNLRSKANVAVFGPPRSGKSSLLYVLFKNYRHAEPDALTWFVDLDDVTTLDNLIEEFYIGMKSDKTDYSLSEFAKSLKQWQQRLVMFIDTADRFSRPPFNDEALFAVLATHLQSQHLSLCVATSRPPETLFTNRVGPPLHSLFIRCDLPPFTPEECKQFILLRLQWTGIDFDDYEIGELVTESGGQPATLQRLAAEMFRRKVIEQEGFQN